METSKKKPTYLQISELSGISVATISRIMNNNACVSDKNRQKITDALISLGYDPSEYLPQQIIETGEFIMFNIPSIMPHYGTIIQGASDAARRNGYSLLVNQDVISDSSIDKFIEMLLKTKPAGIIISCLVSVENLMRIKKIVPVVQCCECCEGSEIPFVTIDDVTAAKRAVEHLITLGKKRIALLNGSLSYKYARDRLNGYTQALSNANLEIIDGLQVQLDEINYDMALSAACQMLYSAEKPDAFFCSSDVYAAAAIKAASKVGLKVPDDILVVGFDNSEISYMCTPAITTVNQPKYQMGLLSCDMLIKRINDRNATVQNMYLDTELIIRDSTIKTSNQHE